MMCYSSQIPGSHWLIPALISFPPTFPDHLPPGSQAAALPLASLECGPALSEHDVQGGEQGLDEFGPQRSGVGTSEIELQVTSQSWAGLTVAPVDVGTIYIKEKLALSVLSLLVSSHTPLLNIPV